MSEDDTNRCVCCGEIIPEGSMVCPKCERESCLHLWQFDRIVRGNGGERYMSWKCQFCGLSRLEKPAERSLLWPKEE